MNDFLLGLGTLNQSTLVVIGNGFDLASGIRSSYADFRQWAGRGGKGTNNLGYFIGDIWGNVEEGLGKYNEKNIFELCAPEEELDIEHISRDVDSNLTALNCFFKQELDKFVESFNEWVDSISLDDAKKIVGLSSDSKYLTFNYTETLEKVYGIPDKNIRHIHGKRFSGEDYTFGHNNYRDLDSAEERRLLCNDKDLCWYLENPYQKIVDWMNKLVKDPHKIIDRNRDFFENLTYIENIVVLGHSFSEIDWPYFDEIVRQTGTDIPWVISYYSDKDQQRINSFVAYAGLKNVKLFDFERIFQED